MVEGPMLGNPEKFLKGSPAKLFGQQPSFHTEGALKILFRWVQ